jgi:co-chaperonin GroES (HSP10)
MRAINNYIIVEKIKQGPKKVGGLILTEDVDVDNRYIKAKVISTGNLVEGINNEDVVYYDKHAGHGVQYKETLYHVIRSMDVVLIDT